MHSSPSKHNFRLHKIRSIKVGSRVYSTKVLSGVGVGAGGEVYVHEVTHTGTGNYQK